MDETQPTEQAGAVDPYSAFNGVSVRELRDVLQHLTASFQTVKQENDIFMAYGHRVDQSSKYMRKSTLSFVEDEDSSSKTQDPGAQGGVPGRGGVVWDASPQNKLTAEMKCEIVTRELDESRYDIEQTREDSEQAVINLRAVNEEYDIRLSELKKTMYEFKRDVVQGAVNSRTGKVIAERVVRYFEEKLRSRDTLIEKLRLKNSTLMVQKNKLHMQLKQKEEMGEVLHAIDFDQLQIENKQYLDKIEERNQDLLRLKFTAGNTLQVLNNYKRRLNMVTLESDRLQAEISQRDDMLARIVVEAALVEEDRAKALVSNKKLRKQLEDFVVPEVLDYVSEKADQQHLTKTVKTWERKVEIAEMALRKQKKIWRQIYAKDRVRHMDHAPPTSSC